MVERAELFSVADALVQDGRVPSQRLIRERLSRKGSFSDIGPHFLAWCVERNFRPRPTKDDLPEHLRERLAKVAAEIWGDGVRQGAAAGQDDRARLEAERDTLRSAWTEALTMVDALEERVRLLEEDRAERSARQRRRAEEFWDRVMLEIVEILGDEKVRVEKIIERLSPETRREAAGFPDGLEPSRIAGKMRERVKRHKYFAEPDKDTFRRLDAHRQDPSVDTVPAQPTTLAPLRALARRSAEDGD